MTTPKTWLSLHRHITLTWALQTQSSVFTVAPTGSVPLKKSVSLTRRCHRLTEVGCGCRSRFHTHTYTQGEIDTPVLRTVLRIVLGTISRYFRPYSQLYRVVLWPEVRSRVYFGVREYGSEYRSIGILECRSLLGCGCGNESGTHTQPSVRVGVSTGILLHWLQWVGDIVFSVALTLSVLQWTLKTEFAVLRSVSALCVEDVGAH